MMKKMFINQRVAALFALLALSFAAYAQGGRPAASEQSALISEFDVNGLKVIVKQRPNSPTVSAGLFVRGGARNLTPATAGLENMMISAATEASKKYPRDVMRKELTRLASTLGAGSNVDFSVFSLGSTRPNFDRTWDLFADAVVNPAFAKADFDVIRDRTITALRNQSISPDSALDSLAEKVVYAGHPYAADPNGTVETISKFTVADLAAYHKKVMTTSQLLLVVVGDIDPAAFKARVASTLGMLPRGSYKEQPLPALVFAKPSLDITSRALETNYIKGLFAAPSIANPDYYAMRVAMTILQSKVIQEVRGRRQLSYAPNAEMEDEASNTAYIYVTAQNANLSVSIMLRLIDEMRQNGVDPDEFTGLPGYFLTTYFLKQETNAAQAAELARYELIGGGWRNSVDFIGKIQAVKAEDVRRVAEKYMKNIRFVVVGNPAAIDRKVFQPE